MNRLAPFLISMVLTVSWTQTLGTVSDDLKWAKRIESGKEVITNLQFYFHDILSGNSPTAVRVAQAPQTSTSKTLFGTLMMVDDPLTEGPEPTSKNVGQARGLYGSAGQSDLGLIMVLAYCFNDGIYKGSSFSVMSINPAMEPVRELAIVGGTGLFRMSRGYVIAQTHWFDSKTGDAIVRYNATTVTNI